MRVESVSLPLRFILTGLAALFCGVTLIVFRPAIVASYHYNQWVLAVTHLFTLGWISSVIFGAMYQLVPVALETKLHSSRQAAVQFWLHMMGWPGLAFSFWISNAAHVAYFGIAVAAGVAVFIYTMARTLRSAPVRNGIWFGITSALVWLALTIAAGLYVAFSKVAAIGHFDPLAQMHAHAHIGAVGFFLMMLVAVSYKLVPMFTLSEVRSERRVWWSLGLLNAGLLTAIIGILTQSVLKPLSAGLLVAGFVVFGIELRAIIATRQRRQMDVPLKSFAAGLLLLIPLGLLGMVLSLPSLPANAVTTQLENVYGLLTLAGVLSTCILAMLYKIVPFLIWYYSYSRHIGRSKVPSLAELSSTRLQVIGFSLWLPSLAGLCAGAISSSEVVVRCSAALMLGSLLVFCANIVRMLCHLWRPRLEPLLRKAPVALKPQQAS